MKFSIKPLCIYVGALRKKDTIFKTGIFFYDFPNNNWQMSWDDKEFKYRRDCILSVLPNNQGIPLVTSEAAFVNLLRQQKILEYVNVFKAITPD